MKETFHYENVNQLERNGDCHFEKNLDKLGLKEVGEKFADNNGGPSKSLPTKMDKQR
jgi:hypothetical protein